MKLRLKLLRWLHRSVFKKPEGFAPNKTLKIIHAILFPCHAFYERQSEMKYDLFAGTYTIKGIKFSEAFFEMWANGEMNRPFQIIKREDGLITVQEFEVTDDTATYDYTFKNIK